MQRLHCYAESAARILRVSPLSLRSVGLTIQMYKRFQRLVIDEFTYTNNVHLVATRSVKAEMRWILSGTPPLKDITELKMCVLSLVSSQLDLTWHCGCSSITSLLHDI